MRSSALLRAVVVFLLLALASSAWAADWDMTPGVTDYSQQVYNLHRTILGICVVIAIVVFAAMFWAVLFHRKSKGHEAAHFHESTKVEIIWTIIPFLILVIMAVPATKILIIKYNAGNADLTVRVTGSRWKWNYEYLSYGDNKSIGLSYYSVLSTPHEQLARQGASVMDSIEGHNVPDFSKDPNYLMEVDKPLVIPSGQKVRFLVTSDDVIHGWWVPDFAIKQDAVPGFINDAWVIVPPGKEGTYIGRCTVLCGQDHAFMPVVIVVKSQADFATWLSTTKQQADADAKAAANSVNYKFASLDEAMTFGKDVYDSHCAACHQPGGTGLPNMFPALKGSPIASVKGKQAEHIQVVQNGRNGRMPAWKGILSPKEMAGVITYERNAWGNNTGDLVQPSDVATK